MNGWWLGNAMWDDRPSKYYDHACLSYGSRVNFTMYLLNYVHFMYSFRLRAISVNTSFVESTKPSPLAYTSAEPAETYPSS